MSLLLCSSGSNALGLKDSCPLSASKEVSKIPDSNGTVAYFASGVPETGEAGHLKHLKNHSNLSN